MSILICGEVEDFTLSEGPTHFKAVTPIFLLGQTSCDLESSRVSIAYSGPKTEEDSVLLRDSRMSTRPTAPLEDAYARTALPSRRSDQSVRGPVEERSNNIFPLQRVSTGRLSSGSANCRRLRVLKRRGNLMSCRQTWCVTVSGAPMVIRCEMRF